MSRPTALAQHAAPGRPAGARIPLWAVLAALVTLETAICWAGLRLLG